LSSTIKCDPNIAIMVINLVTPKARAKHEHLFNELASELFAGSLQ
jgi:hypothetical protein